MADGLEAPPNAGLVAPKAGAVPNAADGDPNEGGAPKALDLPGEAAGEVAVTPGCAENSEEGDWPNTEPPPPNTFVPARSLLALPPRAKPPRPADEPNKLEGAAEAPPNTPLDAGDALAPNTVAVFGAVVPPNTLADEETAAPKTLLDAGAAIPKTPLGADETTAPKIPAEF